MAFAERLESMGRKKHELETAIHELEKQPQPDELAIRRLKTQKLALKDQMTALLEEQAATEEAALQAAE